MAAPRWVVGGSFLVALVLAGGAAVALNHATSSGSSTAAPSPAPLETTPAPIASETPSPSPSLSPSPSPSSSPVATVTATPATPAAPATATPAPSPTAVTQYAYPKPTRHYTALYLAEVGYDPDGDTGHPAPYLKARAVDGDGTIRLRQIAWGDGTVTNGAGPPAACRPAPSPTARPGPYTPHGDDVTYLKDHTYKSPGTYTIAVTVDSGNADCRPNGPAAETATARLTVTV